MTHLEKLRARLNEKAALANTKAKEIGDLIAKDDKSFTAEDITALKEKTAEKSAIDLEIKGIEDDMATLKAAEAAKATYAAPATQQTGAPATVKSETFTPAQEVGMLVYGMMKAYHGTGAKGMRPTLDALDEDGFGEIAAKFSKSLNTGTGSAGGVVVPPNFNPVIADMLMPYTGFLRGNPTTMPMPTGSYRQAAAASRPVVGYRAEGGEANISQPTFRDFTMSVKLLSGIVPVTNQLIRFSAGRASTMASNLLASAMGIAMDSAAFLGTGLSNTPLGIFKLAGITTFVAANSTTPSAAQIDADCRKLLNVPGSYAQLQMGLAWVMPQRIKGYLEDLKNAQGALEYPGLSLPVPTFKTYPVIVTASIPVNGGVGTNEGTIGLVSFGTVLMGEGKGLEMAISSEASIGAAGSIVSMFSSDQTAIRATMEHDFNATYVESIGTLTAVKWGG